MFTKSQTNIEKKNLSSFYVEINQNYLPEPLILTILLDCKTQNGTVKTYHLSIEKDPNLTQQESELASCLFGGNKGYNWLTSFLELMQSIKLNVDSKPYLLMTQNKMKLLTVLANLLATHLSIIDRVQTFQFVQRLSKMILLSLENSDQDQIEEIYLQIKNVIPKAETYQVPDS